MQEKTLTGGRSYYLDIARAIAIISISLNHAVNRTYDNYAGQMEEFLESSYLSSLLKSVATIFSHLGVRHFFAFSRRQGDGIVTGKSEGNHLALSAVCGKISRNIDSCRREGHPRRRGEREA